MATITGPGGLSAAAIIEHFLCIIIIIIMLYNTGGRSKR